MMKKMFFATLACVALASCVSETNRVPEANRGQRLSFGAPVLSTQTRNYEGEITGTDYPETERFVVYAVEHMGDFAGWEGANIVKDGLGNGYFPTAGEIVTKGDDQHWYTSNPYYLPSVPGNKLSFAAVSPARVAYDGVNPRTNVTYGPSGLIIVDWVMPETDPYDLMYSSRTLNVSEAEVSINFKHALSSIRFQFVKPAVEDGGAYQVLIKKLAVKAAGLKNKGTFTNGIEIGNKEGAPSWTLDPTPESVSGDEYVLFEGDDYEVQTSLAEIGGVESFMPLPQNVTSNMKVAVTYQITQIKDGTADAEVTAEIPFTDFIYDTDKHTTEWKMSNRYIYQISFGAMTKIYFHPNVTDWVTTGNAGVYVIK